MGGKQSKNKQFKDLADPINDPTYFFQGELNPDIDQSYSEVWVRREDPCMTIDDDDGKCKSNAVERIYRETVLSGTEEEETVLSGTEEKETVLSGTEEEETVLSGTEEEETVLSGTEEEETVLSGTEEEETDLSGTEEEETVLSGTEEESFHPDHYDMIDESLLEDKTELKQVVNDRAKNVQPNRYHELPTTKRHPDYENMVKIFKPFLVENVIVRRLLPHISFLSNPDRIRAIEERDPPAAVIYLIDELCNNSRYSYIVDTMRERDQREYLKIITPILRELINPSQFLLILWNFDVLSNEDNEEIVQIELNLGPLAAATKLLDLVPRRHKHWYTHLVDALRKANNHEAADMLDIPEILKFEDEDSPQCEMESAAEITESDDVENVIPLSVSTLKIRSYYSYTAKCTPRPKAPIPTPVSGTEDVPPSLPKRRYSSSHGKGTMIHKPPRAAPRRRTLLCKNALTHEDKDGDERAGPNASQNEGESTE